LDLLGMVGAGPAPSGEKPAVRWARLDAAGCIGRAAWPGSGIGVAEDLAHLHERHRVGVILAVADDAGPLLNAAAELGLDVRHLRPSDRGERLEQQVGALLADLRAGRRTVVVSADPASAALMIACALVRAGRSVEEAAREAGALDGPRLEALREFASARANEGAEPTAPPSGANGADEARHGAAAKDGSHGPGAEEGDGALDEAPLDLDDAPIAERREGPRARLDAAFATPRQPRDLAAVARSPRAARLAGAVLGAAIGDAMGHETEFIRSFEEIRKRFGPEGVTKYERWGEHEGRRVALYTDDTQMAEQVLRSLLWARARGADLDETMRDMAERFVEWSKHPQGGHRAPGNACLAGCRNLERGVHWSQAGGATAGGCGSVMRAYPFGLVFAHDLARAEAWSVAHSRLTHRDPIALAASAAMAVGMARVMRDEPVDVVLSEMVAAACRYSPKTAEMMARAIDEAKGGVGPETTLERLEGWAAHEAIAAAVYIFARHPDDPRAAILEGANTPGDSDSIATLAGALTGARAGIGAIPEDWVRDLERSEELLALALQI
ncbi:MAG TPA: ADP-ribosylglycohydrolase family protein, partial [Sandaracinaceae bacterium]